MSTPVNTVSTMAFLQICQGLFGLTSTEQRDRGEGLFRVNLDRSVRVRTSRTATTVKVTVSPSSGDRTWFNQIEAHWLIHSNLSTVSTVDDGGGVISTSMPLFAAWLWTRCTGLPAIGPSCSIELPFWDGQQMVQMPDTPVDIEGQP